MEGDKHRRVHEQFKKTTGRGGWKENSRETAEETWGTGWEKQEMTGRLLGNGKTPVQHWRGRAHD
ncbi:MAG TPA: hypothetical protein GXZ26_05555 [Firmicutes bacterium]|nr:hypothetical protein [Bacillota bacterium]